MVHGSANSVCLYVFKSMPQVVIRVWSVEIHSTTFHRKPGVTILLCSTDTQRGWRGGYHQDTGHWKTRVNRASGSGETGV